MAASPDHATPPTDPRGVYLDCDFVLPYLLIVSSGLVVEAWAQGFLVGSLIVMA